MTHATLICTANSLPLYLPTLYILREGMEENENVVAYQLGIPPTEQI